MTNKKIFANRLTGLLGFGISCLLLLVSACDNGKDNHSPLGPSNAIPPTSVIEVTPLVSTVSRGDSITFVASGGTDTFTWTVSNNTLGTIVSTTGVFTAGTDLGTLTVFATDGDGLIGQATVTIIGDALVVTPVNAIINLGEAVTFDSTGVAPFFWTLSNVDLGTIATNTGVLTANGTTGTGTVNVVDSANNVGSATITIVSKGLVISPHFLTLNTLPNSSPTFTATGNVGTVFFTFSGLTNGYTGATINTSTGVVTITSMPTAVQGDQTLIIRADDGIVPFDTATLVLEAQAAVTP